MLFQLPCLFALWLGFGALVLLLHVVLLEMAGGGPVPPPGFGPGGGSGDPCFSVASGPILDPAGV